MYNQEQRLQVLKVWRRNAILIMLHVKTLNLILIVLKYLRWNAVYFTFMISHYKDKLSFIQSFLRNSVSNEDKIGKNGFHLDTYGYDNNKCCMGTAKYPNWIQSD